MNYLNPNANSVLPWHLSQWDLLFAARQKNRLPHALLLVGQSGLGQRLFAEQLAKAVLCQTPNAHGYACQQCHACHLADAKTHPDFVVLEPEQAGSVIKIDPIRRVVNFINETPMQGGYRVVLLDPAHALNHNAANALLKTLEEPTPNVLLILISDQHTRLPMTILSRCQKCVFHKPQPELALQWLAKNLDPDQYTHEMRVQLLNFSEGSPLDALTWIDADIVTLRKNVYQALLSLSQGQQDPLSLAAEWHDKACLLIVSLMLSWLRDLLRCILIQEPVALVNQDYAHALVELKSRLSPENLLHYSEFVQNQYAKIQSSHNLNRQLLLEELFIRWRQLYVPG